MAVSFIMSIASRRAIPEQARSHSTPGEWGELGRVVRVEADVLVGEIAGVEGAAARSEREPQPEQDFALVLEIGRGGGSVERERCAIPVQRHVPQPERHLLLLKID